MNWLNKLEQKIGRFAIKGLMTYIVGFNVLVYCFSFINQTENYFYKLALIPELVLRGEIWRLLTFIFIPPSTSPIFFIFVVYLYYLIGNSLEHEWGSFKFNVYYFLGMIGTILGAFLTGGVTTAVYLNLSLFLAFSQLYPDYEFYIFFLLPVKVKYLAWIQLFYIGYTVLVAPLPLKVAALVSIINFFLFFGRTIIKKLKRGGTTYYKNAQFKSKMNHQLDQSIHRCTICGITEKDNPEMQFRYCSKCDGDFEYCREHLHNHEHIKNDSKPEI